ncbi:MAG: SGNH/GDSL hydrolase family protein [Rhizobiales bacterium]|nr:SGNH/GDSL hydrolase family protein [Hyphomicrobiales bacterium]
MRTICTAALAATFWLVLAGAQAALTGACAIPDYLVTSEYQLKRVALAAEKRKSLRIAVVGTGSSILAGPDGPGSAYPARLEAALRKRLPGIEIKVVTLVRTRLTALDLARSMRRVVEDEKPDLVIWQTGTIDAIRRIDQEEFKIALDRGVERLQKAGTDVILMNMQYSPRTESMIAVGPYSDTMRVVAQQRSVPLFDRLGIMRYWSDHGAFDLYAAGRDNVLAHRVHDCIGRAIARLIVESGRLQQIESRAIK